MVGTSHPDPHPPVPFKVRALFKFTAENAAELSMSINDIITVIQTDEQGWWEGQSNNKRGLFPSNYVEIVPAETIHNAIMASLNSPYASTVVSPHGPVSLSSTGSNYPISSVSGDSNASSLLLSPHSPLPVSPTSPIYAISPSGTIDHSQLAIEKEIVSTFHASAHLPGAKIKSSQRERNAALKKLAFKAPTQFGQWAHNMAMISGGAACMFGTSSVIWFFNSLLVAEDYNSNMSYDGVVIDPRFGHITLAAGIYAIVCGMLTMILEHIFGRQRTPKPFPSRACMYFLAAAPMFLSLPTIVCATFYILSGCVNLVACYKREHYEKPTPAGKKASAADEKPADDSMVDSITQYCSLIHQRNKIGSAVFLFLYIATNCAQYAYTLNYWLNLNAQLKDSDYGSELSDWAPFAKGFGGMLDLNCAIIVVPVLRTILRSLYNRSTADQGILATTLRTVLYIIPLDQNLEFHKLIAKMIVLSAFGHVFLHFVNVSLKWDATIAIFGVSAWFTGPVILVAMLFIYSAVPANVKHHQFEIFWYCHHSFVLFFVTIIFHGHNLWNPHYPQYFVLPGTLYLAERCMRAYRAYKRVSVLSVTVMSDVISIEFDKVGVFADRYKEGQYVFLQCPTISPIEWHPFTISSAPEEKSVTVHIRVQGENSWTRRVCDYFSSFGPVNRPYIQLTHHDHQGNVQPGKIVGPNGKTLMRIDGPHSAPTQHIGEYDVAVIVGAGIGATPVSSALKSVVFHKWRMFMGACFPDHAYFMWVCAHKDIDAFRWLIRVIKDAQDEVVHMRYSNPQNMKTKTFEFHIWVSSVPKDKAYNASETEENQKNEILVDDEVGFWGLPGEDALVNKVRADWDEADLYSCMKRPPKHTQFQDIHVWEGRPKWEPRFQEISRNHPYGDIGVTFCGNPAIAKDLKKQCHKQNRARAPSQKKGHGQASVNGNKLEDVPKESGLFKLHKENF